MALAAGAAMYAFWPIVKLTRGWNDFSFLYAAGRTWLAGFSPYDFDRWNVEWAAVRPIANVVEPMAFVYPRIGARSRFSWPCCHGPWPRGSGTP